ncbi:MAG: hypothetical protein LBG21_01090 [Campylobacteraceae bacterium]|jgi:hypothetical protein|nr:hypothetical protein [Campylobacteraceae bacterium]
MKKIITALCSTLFLSTNVFALGGDVVTDPGSYVYYADQLKALNDQIKSAVEMLDQLDKANKMLNDVKTGINDVGNLISNPTSELQGFLYILRGLQNKVEKINNGINDVGLETFLTNSHMIANSTDKIAANNFLNVLIKDENDETLKKLYDEYKRAMNEGTYEQFSLASDRLSAYLNAKGITFDQLKRDAAYAVIDAWRNYNLDVNEIQEREDRVKRWAQHLNNIQSSKDLLKQTQITNLILLDMAEILQKQYEHTMSMDYAISLGMIAGSNGKKTNVENYSNVTKTIQRDEGRVKTGENDVQKMIRENEERFDEMEKDILGLPKFRRSF